jgi:hypothetical protein
MLNGTPTQYIELASNGITAVSPTAITLQSPANKVEGPLEVTEATTLDTTLAVTGTATFTSSVEANGGLVVTGGALVSGTLHGNIVQAGNGFSGTFATGDSRTVTVVDGIITGVA